MNLRSLSALSMCLVVACGDGRSSSSGEAGAGGNGGGSQGSGGAGGGNGGGSQGSGGAGGGSSACDPGLPTFADGKTPSSTLYVAAGAPAGGDGSQGKPFAALSDALKVVTPGAEVRVSGELTGLTYTTGVKGTEAAPIWITGEPGAKIGPLTLEGASYVIAQDLELSQSDGHVLHFFFADHLLFRRLRIHDAGQGCIKGSQTTFAYVEDSELWAAGKQVGHPIIDFVGVNTGHIVRSSFHEGPGVMIMLKGGTSDMLFAWNEVYNQTSPGNALALGQSTGPMYFQPKDAAFEGLRIVAFANLLHDLVGAPVAFEGCKDCAALHNTIWNTTGAQLVRFLPGAAGEASGLFESKPEGCRFTGNIVVGGQESGASLNADPESHGPGNSLDYNVFLKPGSLNWWGDLEQDMVHSTYDQDPQLSPEGVPSNTALVEGKGPPDIGDLPFASSFVRDAKGACIKLPADIGAIAVP
ncbi:MAG TPA: hypothetical protein VE093_20195 [Polyangiaceae bacterium]|nr:hypothetical protein [Polyangiaceae bacterium]